MTHKTRNRMRDAKPTNVLAGGRQLPLTDNLDPQKLTEFRKLLVKKRSISIDTTIRVAANKIIEDPEYIKYAMKFIDHLDCDLAGNASEALGEAAIDEKSRDQIIAALVDALENGDDKLRYGAILTFDCIARRGTDISFMIPVLMNAMKDNDKNVMDGAAGCFGEMVQNIKSRTKTIVALVDALKDTDLKIRYGAAKAFACVHGFKYKEEVGAVNISFAIPALVEVLRDTIEGVRKNAAKAFINAVEKGADMFDAVPALIDVLNDKNKYVRWNAAKALKNAAANGDYKTMELIMAGLMQFMQSKEFMKQANNNTQLYHELIKYVDDILDAAHKSEKIWAEQGATA